MSDIHRSLLTMLVCPVSKSPLRWDNDTHELVSDKVGLAYPVRDGIPILLADEARQLSDDEQKKRS